jgi:hypothetical protein
MLHIPASALSTGRPKPDAFFAPHTPRGYRNGHHKPRSIGVGMGAVEVRMPRLCSLDDPAYLLQPSLDEASVDGLQIGITPG